MKHWSIYEQKLNEFAAPSLKYFRESTKNAIFQNILLKL